MLRLQAETQVGIESPSGMFWGLTLNRVAVDKGTKAVISMNFSAYGKRTFRVFQQPRLSTTVGPSTWFRSVAANCLP